MKLNCLIYDTQLKNDIILYMKEYASDMVSMNNSVAFPALYKDITDGGVEIDAESIGFLYNELFGDKKSDAFTAPEEVEKIVGATMDKQINSLVDAIVGNDPTTTTKKLGALSPEKQALLTLSKLFKTQEYPDATTAEKTIIYKMQELVTKAAKSLLPKDKSSKASTLHEALSMFFDGDAADNFRRLDGSLNNLKTLFDGLKKEIQNHVTEVTAKLSDEEAKIFEQQWLKYTDSIMNAAYTVMLGKGHQNELLNEALKQIEVNGNPVMDKNGNVNWSYLIENDDPDTIAANVSKLFQDGVKDKSGVVRQYPKAQADMIGQYVKGLYQKKLAAVKQQKIANERTRQQSAKNIISDFLKDSGYINIVKDKNGKLLLTQADWNSFGKMIKSLGDKGTGIDSVVAKFKEFVESKKDDKGNLLFPNEAQQNEAIKSFRDALTAKFMPSTATPNNIDRLIALNNLNNGRAFDAATSAALNKLAGVNTLTQVTLNRIKKLVNAAQAIQGNIVSSSVSPDGNINVGAFAFQALSQIDREIKEILRDNMIDASAAQTVAKTMSDIMNTMSSTLLLNPNNFTENPLTGIGSNIAESVKQLFTNPLLFASQFGKNQIAFWTAFTSYMAGGADTKIINETDLEVDLPAGERLRLSNIGDAFKSGATKKRAIQKGLSIPLIMANTAMRVLFNSFDAGFNAAMIRKNMANSMYSALVNSGKSPSEALKILDKNVFNISEAQNQQLKDANESIMNAMKAVGLTPTMFDKQRNLMDMRMALYQQAILDAENGNIQKTQTEELVKAYIKGAQDVSRKLGGKQKIHDKGKAGFDIPLQFIYGSAQWLTAIQRESFKAQEESEKKGDLSKAAKMQAIGSIAQNSIGKFAGGVANFLALSLTSTPLGLLLTAPNLNAQKKSLLAENNGSIGFGSDPEAIRKYNQLHQMTRAVVVRSAMGTMAMTAALLSYLGADDDDEEEGILNNLMQTKSGRKIIARFVPMATAIAISANEYVQDKKMDTKMERLVDYLSQVTGKKYDNWSAMQTAVSRDETGDKFKIGLAQLLSSQFSVNINQDEQVTKFYNTLRSAVDADYIDVVKDNEKVSSQVYKDAESVMDAVLINGMFDKFIRMGEGNTNRYKTQD